VLLILPKCNLPCSYSCWEDLFLDVTNIFKGKVRRAVYVLLQIQNTNETLPDIFQHWRYSI